MQFGLDVGTYGALATRTHILALAEFAEHYQFASVWLADHIVFPREIQSRYPYSPSGAFPVDPDQQLLEPLATMGVLVGATRRVRIGTAVLVMPYRHPLLLAKMLTTLDQLSGGRIVLGAGVGWLEEEFAALDTAPFASRGRVTDEYLDFFKRACAGGTIESDGEFYQLAPAALVPGSVQRPHIPVMIGGTTNVALRRVARIGDGWLSVAVPMAAMPDRLAVLERACDAGSRDWRELALHHKLFINIGERRESVHGGREPGTGSLAEVQDDVARLAELGFSHVIVRYIGNDAALQQDQLLTFVNEVMPLFAHGAKHA
ncbi:MAG: TIGR03619 family F420-dependent LLM class oxidoreductase [Pseudomonadota bacterium]